MHYLTMARDHNQGLAYVLKKLETSHVEEIAANWKHSDEMTWEAHSLLVYLIENFHSVGLFQKLESGKISDSPIGWCLQHPEGELAHLFVHEKHRRKGYASIIVQCMCSQIVADREVPTAGVLGDNHGSIAFFLKLGFVAAHDSSVLACSYI